MPWNKVLVFVLLLFSHSLFAAKGNFFIVAESGIQETININLCLNGRGPLSCQNYTINHGVIDVNTNIPGHAYPAAGIKVNTPGYTLSEEDSGCTPIDNGYCLFSTSDTSAAEITIVASSSPPDPGTATLSVTHSPLELNVNGPAESLTITNTSSTVTATNISSDFNDTALDGKVQETGNTCAVLAPGSSCQLTFTPGSTAVDFTRFLIEGTNTKSVVAQIAIAAANVADIIVNNPHLALIANSSSGTMTITNASATITATNIASNFSGTALSGKVTETGNTCSSLAPEQSCTLTFTPGSSAVAETSFPIQGSNTNSASGFIAIGAAGAADLEVFNSPLLLKTNGPTGTLTIKNLSSTVTATNIASSFTGTALAGKVTESGNTCSSLSPGSSCTLTYTPGGTAVAQTTFTIQGTNTDTINAAIQIDSITIGTEFGGGIVGCLTSGGGAANLIASAETLLPAITWAPTPLSSLGATSTIDGASNTSTIVAAIGGSPAYAAGRCSDYEVDSQGNTPCQTGDTCYDDWYLPATDELNCLFDNRTAIGGFDSSTYWSSTEANKNSARVILFSNGKSQSKNKANFQFNVRCVRKFTP